MAGKHSSQFLHHQAIHIEHLITALNPKTFLCWACILYNVSFIDLYDPQEHVVEDSKRERADTK